jgi:hypothetical protein
MPDFHIPTKLIIFNYKSITKHIHKTMAYKHLETIKSRQDRINYLSSSISAHTMANKKMPNGVQSFIQDSIDKMNAEYKLLQGSRRWNFNFEGGGWNSVIAVTKEQAIQIASKEYNETEQRFHCKENGGGAIPLMKVNEKTFRVESEADNNALLSLFY